MINFYLKNLKKLLADNTLKEHKASKAEIDGIRRLVMRDIQDADLNELSLDRRFATAYNAALNLARIVILAEGCRITAKMGHHKISFSVASTILDKSFQDYFSLFQVCRRKRNKVDYDLADIVTKTELQELIAKVKEFNRDIFEWLAANHSSLIQ